MAGSTGGMAALLLLCALSVPAAATLAIYQTRVIYAPLTRETFRVDGVATVEIGGATLPDFLFDCNNTNNNGSGIRWSRQAGSEISTEPGTYSGLRLLLENVINGDLDVYTCTDTLTGESLNLNITDENPAVCPVESLIVTQEDLRVQMEVYVSSFPIPTGNQIHWYRPNSNEILENDPNVQFANSRKTLILTNLQLADFGKYQAEYILGIGIFVRKARTEINLDIQVPPVIQMQPTNNITAISERESFSLSCTASGNPPPSIEWVREDNLPLNTMAIITPRITPGSPVSFVSSTLMVPSSLYSDSGRYRCSADNNIRDPVRSDFAEIVVRPTLTLSATSNNQPLSFTDVISQPDRSTFTVTCRGSGAIMWSSSNGVPIPITQTGELYQIFDSFGEQVSLEFTNFSSSQVAMYTCQSPLTDGNNMPITETILVTNSDPAVFIARDVEYVLDGDPVSIEAGIFSSSIPEVRWFRNEQFLDINSDPQLTQVIADTVYTLNIASIGSQYVGMYTVEVTHDGQTASDNINVTYATPPAVSVSQTELVVSEGDEVRVQCEGTGVGVVTTRWFYNNEESSFQDGDNLVIPSVSSSHTGQYECRVSNIAATVTKTVQIDVKYMPFSMIQYNSISSMSNPTISPIFGENTVAPIFMCISDGYPEPTITWRATRAAGFPNGVTTQGGEQQLVWTRQFEYTDSMRYECVSENELGTSITTMELLVQSPPRIDSIYSTQLSFVTPNNYQVPTGFTGLALTCLAFGWPTPHVEWLYMDNTLPDGVVSSRSILPSMGQISANLRFRMGFNSSFTGAYQCVVRDNEQSDEAMRQERHLFEDSIVSTPTPPPTCTVSSTQIHFQIRILETDCTSWGDSLRESFSNAFEDDIARIIQMECNCTLMPDFVQTLELPMCSPIVANSVVFRGTIETDTAAQTEKAYCALSNWQQSSPSININSKFFNVDSDCFLRVDSFSSPECSSGEPGTGLDTNTLIIIIASSVGAVVLIIVVALIICCVSCCLRKNKNDTWRPKDERTTTYARTDPRYGSSNQNRDIVGPTDETTGGPLYSSLNHNIYSPTSQPPLDESLALKQTGSLSKERLLRHSSGDYESLDGGIHLIQTAIDNPDINEGQQFPYDSRPSTGSSSRVISPPQRGPSRSVISATNPIPDYQQLDYDYKGSPTNPYPHKFSSRKASSGDSVSDRKFSLANSVTTGTGTGTFPPSSVGRDDVFSSGSTSQSGSMVSHQPPVGTAYLRNVNSRLSTDHHSASPIMSSQPSDIIDEEERRDSNCSEVLPPYASLSLGVAPSTSMLDNSAYGRVDPPGPTTVMSSEEHQQWYMQSSDASVNSVRHETRLMNGRSTEITPYASIHNSAIPYEPHSMRAQNEHKNSVSSASPRFRVSVDNRTHHTPQPQPYTDATSSQPERMTPQPYSEAVSEGPQPYSEAVPFESSIGSLASQSSFGAQRDMPKFGRITVTV